MKDINDLRLTNEEFFELLDKLKINHRIKPLNTPEPPKHKWQIVGHPTISYERAVLNCKLRIIKVFDSYDEAVLYYDRQLKGDWEHYCIEEVTA